MSRNSSILSVRFPKDLPAAILADRMQVNKYHVNRTVKLYDTFTILKSLTTTGKIQYFAKQREELAFACKISVSMLYNRINELERQQLLKRECGNLVLASWEDACKPFSIDHKHKTTIQYDVQDNKRLHLAFAAVEIQQAQQRQFHGFHYHMDKNPSDKSYLTNILYTHFKDEAVTKNNAVFSQQLDKLQREFFTKGKSFIEQFGTEIYNLVYVRRADTNRCIGTIRNAYNFKSNQSVSYLKKKLAAAGFIAIDKEKPLAAENTVTKWGEDKWFGKIKRRAWVIPDRLNVLLNQFSGNGELQILQAK